MKTEELEKEKNKAAKLSVMGSFFEDFEQRRMPLIFSLFNTEFRAEAILLCCCYIEGFGNQLYWDGKQEKSKENFGRVLKEHGGEQNLCCIHTRLLKIEKLDNFPKARQLGIKLTGILPKHEERTYTEVEIIDLLRLHVDEDEIEGLAELEKHLWRFTFAAFVYEDMRNALVHRLVGPVNYWPADGNTLPDFSQLYSALERIIHVAKEHSLVSGKWFGHDWRDTT